MRTVVVPVAAAPVGGDWGTWYITVCFNRDMRPACTMRPHSPPGAAPQTSSASLRPVRTQDVGALRVKYADDGVRVGERSP